MNPHLHNASREVNYLDKLIMPYPTRPKSVHVTDANGERSAVSHRYSLMLALFTYLCVFTITIESASPPSPVIQATNDLDARFTPGPSKAATNAAPSVLRAVPKVGEAGSNTNMATGSTNALKAASITSMEALDEKHKLAIGDRLSFRIEEDEEDPKPMVVTDSGDLEVPCLGRYPAENKTCKQLAVELKTALEKEYYYHATVIIAVDFMAKSRGRVYLVGPVRMPGPQEIPSDEVLTLSKAILRAGGFNDYADKRNVKVTRAGDSVANDKLTFVVDVGQIFDKGKTEKDLPLEPGDLIYIPERLFRF
jgi:protein involved in polysaccharide export with SLBB domain